MAWFRNFATEHGIYQQRPECPDLFADLELPDDVESYFCAPDSAIDQAMRDSVYGKPNTPDLGLGQQMLARSKDQSLAPADNLDLPSAAQDSDPIDPLDPPSATEPGVESGTQGQPTAPAGDFALFDSHESQPSTSGPLFPPGVAGQPTARAQDFDPMDVDGRAEGRICTPEKVVD